MIFCSSYDNIFDMLSITHQNLTIISQMNEIIALLGQQVKAARRQLGLTQIQLAELAGISYRPIYLLESGKSIHLETLVGICEALGLELTVGPRGGMTLD